MSSRFIVGAIGGALISKGLIPRSLLWLGLKGSVERTRPARCTRRPLRVRFG